MSGRPRVTSSEQRLSLFVARPGPDPPSMPPSPWSAPAEHRLSTAWRQAQATYGDLGLSEAEFVERAIECLAGRLLEVEAAVSSQSLESLIARTPLDDLFLLLAFRHGDRDASLGVLAGRMAEELPPAFRRCGASPRDAEELAAETAELLLLGSFRRAGQGPGLLRYAARSTLWSWLRAVAAHRWKDHLAAAQRRPDRPIGDDDEGVVLRALPAADAGLDPVTADCVDAVSGALERVARHDTIAHPDLHAFAAATLSRRPHQDLAQRYGVPPSTFSRRRKRGATAVVDGVRAELLQRETPDDFLRMQHQLDLDRLGRAPRLAAAVSSFCRGALRRIGRLVTGSLPGERGPADAVREAGR